MDAGEDLPVGAGAVIQREAQQLVRLFHGFAGLDLHHPEIGFAEGVEVHRFGELRLHLHVRLLCLLSGGFGGFQVRKSLVQIQTGEQVFTLDHGSGLRQFAPEVRRLPGPGLRAHTDLGEELFHALRHEGGQQDTADAGGFQQVIEHMSQPGTVGFHILGQCPRGVLVDILVSPLDQLEGLRQGVVRGEGVHLMSVGLLQTGGLCHQLGIVQHGVHSVAVGGQLHAAAHADHGGQLLLVLRGTAACRQGAAEVLVHHGGGAAEKVAQIVGKVGVDGLDQQLIGEVAVRAEGEGPHQEEAEGVHAELLRQQVGVHHVALGFGHFAAVQQQPAVAENVLGQRLPQAHQHGGPDDGVEADDLLAHDVDAGPVFLVVIIAVILIAQRGDIVAQGVHPHIDHVLGVKVHGDAPGEAGTGNAQILQTGVNEVLHHLVDTGTGLEEVSVFQQIPDTVGIFAQTEEVGFLLGVHNGAAAVGAAAVLQLALRPEGLAGSAVLALIGALVDVALVIHPLEDPLDGLHMVIVSGADEAVVGDVHQLPQIPDAPGAFHDAVHELLGSDAGLVGLLLDLLAVLVGTGEEHDVLALQPVIPGQGVGGHGAVGVTDVQLI